VLAPNTVILFLTPEITEFVVLLLIALHNTGGVDEGWRGRERDRREKEREMRDRREKEREMRDRREDDISFSAINDKMRLF
jgi:hypothetical protein